jgi:myosin heavy subunit
MSLLALIEQETLAITTSPPQARIASLASNAEAAAAAASSTSLITANNNSAIIIKHYLGDVVYSIADFIDLNRMTLSAATQSLVASSSNAIVKSSLDAVLSQVCVPTP